MKKLLILFVLISPILKAQNPCKDSLFIALKAQPVEKLTEREFNYMMAKDKDCQLYNKEKAETERVENAQTNAIVLVVLASLVAGLIPLMFML